MVDPGRLARDQSENRNDHIEAKRVLLLPSLPLLGLPGVSYTGLGAGRGRWLPGHWG